MEGATPALPSMGADTLLLPSLFACMTQWVEDRGTLLKVVDILFLLFGESKNRTITLARRDHVDLLLKLLARSVGEGEGAVDEPSWEDLLLVAKLSAILARLASQRGSDARDILGRGGDAVLAAVLRAAAAAAAGRAPPVRRDGFDVSEDAWGGATTAAAELTSVLCAGTDHQKMLRASGGVTQLGELLCNCLRRGGATHSDGGAGGAGDDSDGKGAPRLLVLPFAVPLLHACYAAVAGNRENSAELIAAGGGLVLSALVREAGDLWLLRSAAAAGLRVLLPAHAQDGGLDTVYLSAQLLIAGLQWRFREAEDAESRSGTNSAASGSAAEARPAAPVDETVLRVRAALRRLTEPRVSSRSSSPAGAEGTDRSAADVLPSEEEDVSDSGVLSWLRQALPRLGLPDAAEVFSGQRLTPPPFGHCFRVYDAVRSDCEDIKAVHFDDNAIASLLRRLRAELSQSVEAKYFLVAIRGGMRLMVRTLNNIDESVMLAACDAAYALLLDCPPAQSAFLEADGLAALTGCLQDYNTDILMSALQIAALLASQHSHCRDEVRNSAVLQHAVRICSRFPADDVNCAVAAAAVGVLSHAVTSNVENQNYVCARGGLERLTRILLFCAKAFATGPRAESSERRGVRTPESADVKDASASGASGASPSSTVRRRSSDGATGAGTGAPRASSAESGRSRPARPASSRGGRRPPRPPSSSSSAAGGEPAMAVFLSGPSPDRPIVPPPPGPQQSPRDTLAREGAQAMASLMEACCLTLRNLVYRNTDAQHRAVACGSVRLCLRLLWEHFVGGSSSDDPALFDMPTVHYGSAGAGTGASDDVAESTRDQEGDDDGARGAGASRRAGGSRSPFSAPEDYEAARVIMAEVIEAEAHSIGRPPGMPDLPLSLLAVLVNSVDANPSNQNYLDSRVMRELVLQILVRWSVGRPLTGGSSASSRSAGSEGKGDEEAAAAGVERLPTGVNERIRAMTMSMTCLLLSHLVWNHEHQQAQYTRPAVARELLRMIDAQPVWVVGEDTGVGTGDDGAGAAGAGGAGTPGPRKSPGVSESASVSLPAEPEDPTEREGLHYVRGALDPDPMGPGPAPAPQAFADEAEIVAERCLYALMALINLMHGNPEAQRTVAEEGGIGVVLRQVASPEPSIRKSASFCLGNLVKTNRENALELASHNGVITLVQLLNDEDDDELSKKAFATLTHMGDIAVHHIVAGIEVACASLPVRPSAPSAAAAAVLKACPSEAVPDDVDADALADEAKTMEAAEELLEDMPPVQANAVAALSKLLACLNGLLYTSPECREWLAHEDSWEGGLAPIMRVLVAPVPCALRVHACYCLANLTMGDTNTEALVRRVTDLGALDILTSFLAELRAYEHRMDEPEEARTILYTTLSHLARSKPLVAQLVQPDVVAALSADCTSTTPSNEAGELTLLLAEESAAVAEARSAGLLDGLAVALRGLARRRASLSDAIQARAAQCLLELGAGPGAGRGVEIRK